jgi:hypothetical protein
MRLRRGWDHFWFQLEPPTNLRAARILLAVNALWLVLSRPNLPEVVRWPEPFWIRPDLATRIRFLILPIGYQAEMILWLVLIAALLFVLAGRLVRTAGLLAGILLYHFAPFEDVFSAYGGPNFRGFTVPLLGLLIIAFGGHPHRADGPSPEWRWQLKLIQLLFAFTYLLSGISKLRLAGWRWATGENFEGLVLGLIFPDVAPPWAHWFIGQPALSWVGAINGMLMDFGVVLAVFSPRAARLIVPVTLLAHFAIVKVMGVVFLGFPLLLLFVNWDWLAKSLKERIGKRSEIVAAAPG